MRMKTRTKVRATAVRMSRALMEVQKKQRLAVKMKMKVCTVSSLYLMGKKAFSNSCLLQFFFYNK